MSVYPYSKQPSHWSRLVQLLICARIVTLFLRESEPTHASLKRLEITEIEPKNHTDLSLALVHMPPENGENFLNAMFCKNGMTYYNSVLGAQSPIDARALGRVLNPFICLGKT